MEPEFFARFGVTAEPVFKILVGGLPVLPSGGGAIDGATGGAKIVDVKWF